MKIKKYNEFLESMTNEIDLPNDIINISNAYIKAGKDIYVVGGAVRDFLQNKTPKDWDLVTNALPDESKEILKGFNVSDEQGKNFGVLRVYTKDEPEGYEIASYRRDISGGRDTKGDDQKVEMGGDVTIEDDVNRRDLTVNSLFYDIKNKKIVDLVGGVDDVKNGVIRAVGDASQRFIEDRLRILRIFRFASRIGGKIDSETANAILKDNRLKGVGPKDDVSQERIIEEVKKAWKQAINFNDYLSLFTEFNMWGEVFPGVKINTDLVDSDDFVIVMTNLFKLEDVKVLERKLVQDFKIDTDLSKKILFLLEFSKFTPNDVLDLYKKKISSGISEKTLLEWIDVNGGSDIMKKFIIFKPSVNSQDLMDKGFKGRDLGIKIKELEIENFKELL